MVRINKIVIVSLLVVLGAALFTYGVLFHSREVLPVQDPNSNDSSALARAEPSLILDVTIGGLKREESGNIRQTYSGSASAAAACPT
jgi:hypothetical protein